MVVLTIAVALAGAAEAQLGGATPRRFPHAPPTAPRSAAGPGVIRLALPGAEEGGGERGPLVLAPRGAGHVGEFVVWNDGPGPLTVSRVALRGDEDDPRLPPRFTARFADGGGGSGVIASHASKRVTVTWVPDREPKVHEALGHVVVTSTDEVAGEVAMGFVAPRAGLGSHALSLLLLLPLAVEVISLVMRVTRHPAADRLRGLVLAAASLQCVLAGVVVHGFNGAVTRADGNDGFQFVERFVAIPRVGVEYFVGVDGTSVVLVALTALVGAVGAAAAPRGEGARYHGLYALLLAGVMGIFVALDLALFTLSWGVTLLAVVLLARGDRPLRAVAVARYAAASFALLAIGVGLLYARSDPTFLVDGQRVPHTFAVTELMRVAYNAKHLELFGVSWVKGVWVTLFLAFAIASSVAPFQRGLGTGLAAAPLPVRIVVAALVMKAGVYGILRVSVGVLPDGSRWAATTLVAVGVLTLIAAALGALRRPELGAVAAHVAIADVGFCLVGIGAMTREGLAGSLLHVVSQGLVTSLLFLVAPRDTSTLPGATARGAAAIGLLAAAGLPGLPPFGGEALILLGEAPASPILVALAAAAALVLATACGRALLRLTLPDPALPRAPAREHAALALLVVLTVALGVHPAPFFALVRGAVSDLNVLVNPPGPDEIAFGAPDRRPRVLKV